MIRWFPLLAVLGLLFSFWPADAASPPRQDDTIQQAQVGVYAVSIRDFDTRNGSYTMDLYLTLRCANNEPCDPTNFEIINGNAKYFELQNDTPTLRVYRIQATLYTTLDFHRYPFDQQELHFDLEDELLDDTKLLYDPDIESTNVDPNMEIPGWEIVGSSGRVRGHYYSAWDETYSHYRFTVTIKRPWVSSLLTLVMPALFILLAGIFSLFSPRRVLSLIGVFVAAVLFHLHVLASLPPVNYLTLADWYMILVYIALSVAILISVILHRHPDSPIKTGWKTITDTLLR
jgi:hypothetical protein